MVIVLMGVAGAGKTTIGKRLSRRLGWSFYEGDDFHPPENVEKMRQGIPLTDEDRVPWLRALHRLVQRLLERNEDAVLACSALKQSYRERLMRGDEGVRFVYLKGSYDLIRHRLQSREGHYADADLLDSQFGALEEPAGVVTVEVSRPPDEVVETIITRLGLDDEERGSDSCSVSILN
ncbi:MAG: gluconokinase [Anaerolineales bacterium]